MLHGAHHTSQLTLPSNSSTPLGYIAAAAWRGANGTRATAARQRQLLAAPAARMHAKPQKGVNNQNPIAAGNTPNNLGLLLLPGTHTEGRSQPPAAPPPAAQAQPHTTAAAAADGASRCCCWHCWCSCSLVVVGHLADACGGGKNLASLAVSQGATAAQQLQDTAQHSTAGRTQGQSGRRGAHTWAVAVGWQRMQQKTRSLLGVAAAAAAAG